MADNSMQKLLNFLTLKLKAFFFTKNVLSFSLFLVLSTGFWFVNSFDRIHETEINLTVRLVGVPKNISVDTDFPRILTLKVKDQGVNLFSYRKNNLKALSFDLKGLFNEEGQILFTQEQIRYKLSKFLLPTTLVLAVQPDSLLIKYERLSVKTLPVELNAKIDFAPQYVLAEEISLSPSMVKVFGPKSVIEKLKSVKTESLTFTNVDDTISGSYKLMPIKNVNFSVQEINVNIYIEMFTEKRMQLPITVINLPANINIRTFPAFVNATFNVGLSHFKSVNYNDLNVIFDYNDIVKGDNLKYRLKIKNNTKYISNIQISPREIEYLIELN